MKKILITGSTGLLGRTLIFENKKFEIIAGYFPENNYSTLKYVNKKYLLDIRDFKEISRIIDSEKVEIIIHCALLANVDYVEKHREEAYQTNFIGTKNIVDLCKDREIKFIHISTNAIYDGRNPLYSENSQRNPINYYGKLKVMEEDYVIENLDDYVIIRPILMYGWNDLNERENPFTWQLRMQKENKEIFLVNDIYSNPLLVNDCAKIILKIIEMKLNGIFNIAGSEIVSRYEFGLKIAEQTNYEKSRIKPVPNSYFKEIAPRPKNTSFDITKIKTLLNYIPANIETGIKFLLSIKDKYEKNFNNRY
ncbi:MAG TPA: SDR family oxidoreductase [bacterium]|nr:SDR family oxidoreductase [bacterium]HPQ20119.1 SDR family oxidoreductase [bacterium]